MFGIDGDDARGVGGEQIFDEITEAEVHLVPGRDRVGDRDAPRVEAKPEANTTAAPTLRAAQPASASPTPAAGRVRTATSIRSGNCVRSVLIGNPSISPPLRPMR